MVLNTSNELAIKRWSEHQIGKQNRQSVRERVHIVKWEYVCERERDKKDSVRVFE